MSRIKASVFPFALQPFSNGVATITFPDGWGMAGMAGGVLLSSEPKIRAKTQSKVSTFVKVLGVPTFTLFLPYDAPLFSRAVQLS